MSLQTAAQTQTVAKPPITAVVGGILQRACACGQHTGNGGECEECKKKRQGMLQRSATNSSHVSEVPPIVHEVLHSSGQPLEIESRTFMERGFGQDFSDVRVHTDEKAAKSARAVNALAYTVGRDLVFGSGQFAPQSNAGRKLLAHELAHTVQQQGSSHTIQPKLMVDRADSPYEAEADRAAQSLLKGEQFPHISSAPARINRQVAESSSRESREACRARFDPTDLTRITLPTADAPGGRYTISGVERVSNNERRVRISTGQRYLVTRTPWTRTEEVSASRVSARPGIDREDVWLDIEYCRGSTEGTIRVAANVPQQAIQLVLRTISSGGDVADAWRQASITPSVSGTLRVGQWQVDLSARTTVSSSGSDTGAGGEVSVSADTQQGRVTGGVSGESQDVGGNPFGGVQGSVFIRWEPGAHRPSPRCTRERTRSGFTYECREERDVAPQARSGTQSVTTTDERLYNIFFLYATPDFDVPRNRQTWLALANDLRAGSGFQVTRIEGWASPEGPMHPVPGFMGNPELSRRRAGVVRTHIESACRSQDCFAPGLQVEGLGERLNPTDESGSPLEPEASGRQLEEHVVRSFPTDPRESSVRSRALMEQLRRTPSLHARAELIYPQLRRAIVTLRRSSTRVDPCSYTVPGHTEQAYLPSCPEVIRQAAFPDSAS
jgi:hypothetical protein